MRLTTIVILFAFASFLVGMGTAVASDWATQVVSSSNLDPNYPYNVDTAARGRPTMLIRDPWMPSSVLHCSMVYPACNVSPDGDPLVATVLSGGHITVMFDSPVYDDPENWDGKDFIVFGNAMFSGLGSISPTTNMEQLKTASGGGQWEQATVSVSQNGTNWYTLTPYADDFAPTQMSAWDWVENAWADDLDYTKPVPLGLAKSDFVSIYVAKGIDLYKGSAGGTAYNISGLPLPVDSMGRKWIQYVKVEGNSVELDAVTRVSHKISPISVGAAKNLPDGSRVILENVVVTAGTYEVGRCCYVQDSNLVGIKVLGRVLDTGTKITIYGNMTTVDGERAVKTVAIDPPQGSTQLPTGEIRTVGMANKNITVGLSTLGMLVKTWGKVEDDIDEENLSFVIDDGSGVHLRCIGPRVKPAIGCPANPTNPEWGTAPDLDFLLPGSGSIVTVTGIISTESGEPVLHLRKADDMDLISTSIFGN